jgi:GAF domain
LGQAAKTSRSPWVGIEPGVDPLKWAAVLRKAHRLALDTGSTSPILRPVVASSWRRATSRGVDPDGHAPVALDPEGTRRALGRHPAFHLLHGVERMLREATEDSRYMVALSDADGVLLWANGHPEALEAASEGGFQPGHLVSEQALGTNAVGTAIELSHPVQIFSAEHFCRRLHGLTCSAAPIRDPETGRMVGVLDLSGDFRTSHPHSLPLVTSVSRLVEETLVREMSERDNRLLALFVERLGIGRGTRTALLTPGGRVVASYPKNWLGARVPIEDGGVFVFSEDLEVNVEPLDVPGGAFLVRGRPPGARPRRSAIVVEACSPRRVRVSQGNWRVDLSPRHSEIMALLALHPEGLSSEELLEHLHEPGRKAVTVRAEISRLRRVLGPILLGNPYRLDGGVLADAEALQAMLDRRPVPAVESGH